MIYGWPVLPECEAQYEVGSMRHVNALRTRSLRATPRRDRSCSAGGYHLSFHRQRFHFTGKVHFRTFQSLRA